MGMVYVAPVSAGTMTGSSFANAMAISEINAAIAKAGPGGLVLLRADNGAYVVQRPIPISSGGSAKAPVTIKGVSSRGVDMPVTINGTRNATYKPGMFRGNVLFKLGAGASNLSFANMNINNTGIAFWVSANATNLSLANMNIRNVARFFEDNAGKNSGKTATISGLVIRNVTVNGFSKGVIKLAYDTHNVVIDNVHGDSQRQDGDNFAMGIHLLDTVHDVRITKTSMDNATDTLKGRYWNGDGFATERGVYRVVLEDTSARGNTDAGYDLKSMQTRVVRAIAEDNKKNYRIWGDTVLTDSIGRDPHKRGGTGQQNQVEVKEGSKASLINCKFSDAGTETIAFALDGDVSFSNVAISHASGGLLAKGLNIANVRLPSAASVKAIGPTSSKGARVAPLPVDFRPYRNKDEFGLPE